MLINYRPVKLRASLASLNKSFPAHALAPSLEATATPIKENVP